MIDPLQHLFGWVQIDTTTAARLRCRGDWSIAFRPSAHVRFGVLVEGQCFLECGGQQLLLKAGDGYILTHNLSFRVFTSNEVPTSDGPTLYRITKGTTVEYGEGSGPLTTIAGGRFTFGEMTSNMVLEALPPMVHMRAADPINDPLLPACRSILACETEDWRMGANLVRHHVAQMMLIHALRIQSANENRADSGWLRGMTDPKMGPVLQLMHANPRSTWPVGELARVAGMSRSAFAQRFRDVVGTPPVEYLLRLRMRLAAQQLAMGKKSVSTIAFELGYQSVSAFSTSFRRVMGNAPKEYRPGL